MIELWNQLAEKAGVRLTAEQLASMDRYLDLLLEANATMNLTRIDDRASAEVQHIADALTLLPYLPAGAVRIADVGSGGGVPGIPLAIARPDALFTLIEATQKKAAFLSRAAEALGLKNIRIEPVRAESAGQGPMRESFNVVIARALAAMALLLEWCVPLAKKGGRVLAMKGPKVAEELPAAAAALKALNAGEPKVHPVELPGAEGHVIVEIPKLGRTDPRYPRPGGQAKKKPL